MSISLFIGNSQRVSDSLTLVLNEKKNSSYIIHNLLANHTLITYLDTWEENTRRCGTSVHLQMDTITQAFYHLALVSSYLVG